MSEESDYQMQQRRAELENVRASTRAKIDARVDALAATAKYRTVSIPTMADIERLRAEIKSRDERIRLLESALRRWLDADDAISAIDARDAAEALLAVIGKGAP
jgi:hypothetical protein